MTSAQASSRTSRRIVSSQRSSRSGRPPGRLHPSPSLLTNTIRSPLTQIAAAPCGVPGGGSGGGCHATCQS
jgi:hypothetical protein